MGSFKLLVISCLLNVGVPFQLPSSPLRAKGLAAIPRDVVIVGERERESETERAEVLRMVPLFLAMVML
jgi:hypothetical protein